MVRNIRHLNRTSFSRLIGVACFCVAVSAARAGDSPALVGGPIVGYASRGGLEIRAIKGVPGAAVFGDSISLTTDVVRVRLAPGEPYALLERSGSDPAALPLGGTAAGQQIPIAGALRSADLAAFSPFGSSIVLFSQPAARLQILTGLPGAPRVVRDVDAHLLPERPLALAVSDDGQSVLLSSATTIYLLSPDGSARALTGTGTVAAMAFVPNSGEAALGDPKTGSLYRLDATNRTASLRVASATLKGMGAIAASGDGDTIYATNDGARQIALVRLSTGTVDNSQLQVVPERLDRVGRTDDFLISSQPGRPAWMFAGTEKRAVFIPDVTRARPQPRYAPAPVGAR